MLGELGRVTWLECAASHAAGREGAHRPLQGTESAEVGSFFVHQRVGACLESVSI